MQHTIPHPILIERICSDAFNDEFPLYLGYARTLLRRVGLAAGRDSIPGRAQAEAVVADAVVGCLSGNRRWRADLDFRVFFCGVMRSGLCREVRRIRRERELWGQAEGEPAAPSSRRNERLDAQRTLADARQVLAGDPRTKQMLDAIDDGAETPSDLVEKLGWSANRVKAARVVANRKLAAAGLRVKKRVA